MSAVIQGLLGKDIDAIMAFADANMRLKPASEKLGCHIETLARRLDSVYRRSRMNPRDFRDLVKLVQMIEGDDDV